MWYQSVLMDLRQEVSAIKRTKEKISLFYRDDEVVSA